MHKEPQKHWALVSSLHGLPPRQSALAQRARKQNGAPMLRSLIFLAPGATESAYPSVCARFCLGMGLHVCGCVWLGGRPTGPRDAAGLDVETLNALQALSRTGSVVHVDMDHGTPDAPKPHPGPSPPPGEGGGGAGVRAQPIG